MKWPWARRTRMAELANNEVENITPEAKKKIDDRLTRVEAEVRQMRAVLQRELGVRP